MNADPIFFPAKDTNILNDFLFDSFLANKILCLKTEENQMENFCKIVEANHGDFDDVGL